MPFPVWTIPFVLSCCLSRPPAASSEVFCPPPLLTLSPPSLFSFTMTGVAAPRRAAVCGLRQAPRRRPSGSAGVAFLFGRSRGRKDDAAVLLAQPPAAPVVLEPVVDAETAALRAAYVWEGGERGAGCGVRSHCVASV